MADNKNPYLPELVTITNIIEETPNSSPSGSCSTIPIG